MATGNFYNRNASRVYAKNPKNLDIVKYIDNRIIELVKLDTSQIDYYRRLAVRARIDELRKLKQQLI